ARNRDNGGATLNVPIALQLIHAFPPSVAFTSVPALPGLFALRPVPVLAGKVRPRLAGEIRGDIVSLLIGQRLALSQRHLSLDERGRGVQARHPRPDVERVRAPERWKDGLAVRARDPLPVGAVARRALCRIDLLALRPIRLPEGLDAEESTPRDGHARRHAAGQPRYVRQHRAHLFTVPRQRLAVHGALEAVVDPILEILDSGAAAGILGEEPPDARQWGGPGLPSAVEVATRAVHAGADVRLGVHGRVGQDSFPLAD